MPADDPLSPAELAFRKMLEPVKNPHTGHLELSAEFRVWGAKVREDWERANVVWFYGRNERGAAVWGSRRPKPELTAALKASGECYYLPRSEFLEQQDEGNPTRFVLVKRIG